MTIGSDTSFFNLEHLLLYNINNIQIQLNTNTQNLHSSLIIRKKKVKNKNKNKHEIGLFLNSEPLTRGAFLLHESET